MLVKFSFFRSYPLIILCAIVLSACLATTPTPIIPTETVKITQPYPVPEQATVTTLPYPLPSNTDNTLAGPETYVIPEPGQNTGVVIGQLFDNSNNEPLQYYTIYLATKIAFQDNSEYSYTLDPLNSPHTISDSQGRFAIGEATPGSYILMVWTPIQSSVVIDANTNLELNVGIIAGEMIDIGQHKVVNPMP